MRKVVLGESDIIDAFSDLLNSRGDHQWNGIEADI